MAKAKTKDKEVPYFGIPLETEIEVHKMVPSERTVIKKMSFGNFLSLLRKNQDRNIIYRAYQVGTNPTIIND